MTNLDVKCNKLSADLLFDNKTDYLSRLHGLIYLDNQATTPIDPRVNEMVYKISKQFYGNPHSRSHAFGWSAEDIIEEARAKVAKVINADPKEIIFTSGATESNNMAIKGVAKFYKSDNKNHIITVSTEHKCVIESCRSLMAEGFDVTFLNPEKNGILNLKKLTDTITDKTILVSVMGVNNEIGVIQDIEAIGKICKERKVFFHTDCAQAYGKIPIDVTKMNIDLLSISSHKIYGPKGIGALYIRRHGTPRLRLVPLISGGGQEMGFRSGTLPTPLIAGFGKAAELCTEDFDKDMKKINRLSKMLYEGLTAIPEVILNGDYEKRYKGNLNFSFSYIEGESLIMAMNNLAVSSGSACTSASLEPSYVLKALGLKDELAHSSIRFGIGRFNTEKDITTAIDVIVKAVNKLRELSPLWEMFQENVDLDTIQWKEH